MHPTQVIKRPMITEKTTWQGEARNRYTFEVALDATKPQIRTAVEELYKVRVHSVSTAVRKGKTRRTKFGFSKGSDVKRATVQLHADDKIDLF